MLLNRSYVIIKLITNAKTKMRADDKLFSSAEINVMTNIGFNTDVNCAVHVCDLARIKGCSCFQA